MRTNDANKIVDKELSYKLTGIFFDIHNELGRFLREKQYADAIETRLKKENVRYKRERPISLGDKNSNIVDFVIEDRVIVELKSKPFITKADYFQLMRYLEIGDFELGLMVNFGSRYLKPKRILNPIIRVDLGHSDKFARLPTPERSDGGQADLGRKKDSDGIRSFGLLPLWKRAVILVSGVLMNFLLGWLVISFIFSIGIPRAIVITEVRPNSPAAAAGLSENDKILKFSSVESFVEFIKNHEGQKISLEVERGEEIVTISGIPRLNPPVGEGALGIGLTEVGIERENIFKAIWDGLKMSLQIIRSIFLALASLIRGVFLGQENVLRGVAGPVGIVKITSEAGRMGFIYLLQLLSLISLNLAVINILPFPALDGGRLLFLIIEKIKGSPLPVKFEKYENAIGMALLLLLMVIITVKDISGFF